MMNKRSTQRLILSLILLMVIAMTAISATVYSPVAVTKSKTNNLYVHVMPWFESQDFSGYWGIHWKMSNQDPNIIVDAPTGKRQIASYYYPLTGPYASGDPNLVEYQLLMMKFSGVDGVMIDWPGTYNANDYLRNKSNAEAMIAMLDKVGLKFAVVYEDNNLTLANAPDKVGSAKADMTYLRDNYFNKSSYITVNNRPLLLDFGPQTFKTEADWTNIFSVFSTKPEFCTLWYQHNDAGVNCQGEYSWVYQDATPYLTHLANYYSGATNYGIKMGSASPGFNAFYTAGGWGSNYFNIPSNGTSTFQSALDMAFQNNAQYIQVATWNDYGEGTMIEPTREFGYSLLTYMQQKVGVSYTQTDLEMVLELYTQRKKYVGNATEQNRLDQVFYYLVSLQMTNARNLLYGIITNSDPTMSFAAINKSYDDASFSALATSNSAGAITYSIIAGASYASITSAGVVTITGPGVVTIQASQAANGTYNAKTITTTLSIKGPFGGVAWAIPGQIEAENYDIGGEGITWHETTASNSGAVYRTDDVDVGTTTDNGVAGYTIGWTDIGEWLTYTTNVSADGVYDLHIRQATTLDNQTIHVEIDGVNVSGTITYVNTGAWTTWNTITINNITITKGKHLVKIVFETGGANLNWISFTGLAYTPESDYETKILPFTGFAGSTYEKIANPFKTGINTSNNVGHTLKGNISYAGIFSPQLSTTIDFSTKKAFKLKVYSPVIGSMLFKLENSADATKFQEITVQNTKINTWEQLIFNCSASTSGLYDKITLFFNFGSTAVNDFYFDDLLQDILITTAVDEIGDNELAIFPNPVVDLITIKSDNLGVKGYEISDLQGRTLAKAEKLSGNSQTINLGELEAGIYILKVYLEDDTYLIRKIVKE